MEWVKLGDVGKIITGNTPSKKNKSYYDSPDINFVSPGDIVENNRINELTKSENHISFSAREKARIVSKNSILVTCIGIIGKVAKVKINEVAFNQQINAIVVDENKYDIDYVAYAIMANKRKLSSIANAAVVPLLNKSQFSDFKIFIDKSLEKQKDVSSYLNKIEKLIQTRQDQIQALDDLIESLYYEFVFTNSEDYKKLKLDDISIVRSSSRVLKKDLIDKGVPFYRGQEISLLSKNIEFEPEYYIGKELYNTMKEKSGIPKKGDLLLPSIANEGQIWVVDTDKEFYFKDGRVLWIDLDENKEINPIYLRYYLKYKLIQEFDSISSGSTFAELKIFILKDIDVLLPPIEKQNLFAAFVEKIEKQKRILNDSLEELNDLFDSLMQDAFDGSMMK